MFCPIRTSLWSRRKVLVLTRSVIITGKVLKKKRKHHTHTQSNHCSSSGPDHQESWVAVKYICLRVCVCVCAHSWALLHVFKSFTLTNSVQVLTSVLQRGQKRLLSCVSAVIQLYFWSYLFFFLLMFPLKFNHSCDRWANSIMAVLS